MSNKVEDDSKEVYASEIRVQELDADVNEPTKRHGDIIDLAARAHLDAVDYTEAESKAVLRKIDWRLMPLLVWVCESEYHPPGSSGY